ncbi:hypothetical protein Mgra_00000943 [Meloidogyne graminicola]|uniref:SAM domain-containing protein n=1 Tax=Meloidogyne graminicola TaxID=189291 RepID=A0A8T0A2K5_9BILA|nr:hypothetical protein Mgra_00000943 [Meloidogyne graminicola]
MRRRFLLGGESGKKSSLKKGNLGDPLQQQTTTKISLNTQSSASASASGSSFPFLSVLNRRSFAAADGPKRNAALNYYSAFKEENDKYATIGGIKQQKKTTTTTKTITSTKESNGLRTSSAHSSSSSPPPPPPPRRSPLLFQRNGRSRPRSMGAPLLQQMGIKCSSNNNNYIKGNNDEEAETAFINVEEDFPVGAARLMSNRYCHSQQQQQQHCSETTNNNHITNRNSTGSTNSSQTSSGFESSKSSSSHQLVQISGCSPNICHKTEENNSPLFQNEDNNIASSTSSRLSSTGSSTATTQGGRSSAYFSLSDGLDLSSTGIGGEIIDNGTLTTTTTTTTLKKVEKSLRGRRGNCSRINIGEMLAKGIPEQEIFAEWLQCLCLSEYLSVFLAQGYDLPTLARATPEDLTTLGITKPDDRKCLVQDIQSWRNVKDQWPTEMSKETPTRDWLTAIGLKQYIQQFELQGCLNVSELEQLEAEDLEDMGVQKLGHAKRIWLALRKLKDQRETSSNGRVQFRNSSFGLDPVPDKGPPRLNLYRTSQIIAQLPKEPPELIEKEDDVEEGLPYIIEHIPPPPAPMPLLPILAFPSSSNSTRLAGSFGCSLSQPSTPRNVQRMFSPQFGDLQNQQNFEQKQQNLTFLHSPPSNRRNENQIILLNSQFPQRNGFVQSSDLTELYGSNGITAASAR